MLITIITDAFWNNCTKCFIYIYSSYVHNNLERSYCFHSGKEKTEAQESEVIASQRVTHTVCKHSLDIKSGRMTGALMFNFFISPYTDEGNLVSALRGLQV